MDDNETWLNILNFDFDECDWTKRNKKIAIKTAQNDLKFLMENYSEIDNYISNHLFLISCAKSVDTSILIFLNEKFKINVAHENKYGIDFMAYACMHNENLDIIKYLVNDLKINQNHLSNDCRNFLMHACSLNTNIEIVKYLVNDLRMNIKHLNLFGDNCLMIACQENTNIEIIKYLIHVVNMDINHLNHRGDNCLLYSSMNTSVGIIKYLINVFKMNVNQENNNKDNCLMRSCMVNKNLDVVKFLINEVNMNVNHTNNDNDNCLDLAVTYNTNLLIIKYLIEKTKVKIKTFSSLKLIEIIPMITENFDRLNELLDFAVYFRDFKMISVLKTINPFLLNEKNQYFYGIDNPISLKFKEYVKFIDELQCRIPLPEDRSMNTYQKITFDCDFSYHSEILFKHNEVCFYGHKSIVYDSIILLKNIKDHIEQNEEIILEGKLPKHIINQYIISSYTHWFNIQIIEPEYFIEFLKFIDQYPTIYVSINLMEDDIIKYMKKYDIPYDDYMNELCHRYGLKIMYLNNHNNEFVKFYICKLGFK